jgi:nicotinamide-nucleotide amidase
MIERTIVRILGKKKLTVAIAESCTGGLISHALTNVPGSSRVFLCGVVAYANAAKSKILGVKHETLELHGAVSQETALELAQNIRRLAASDIGLGITGIAGPDGGSLAKPVGTVFIAVSIGPRTYFKKFNFSGTRLKIKTSAKEAALHLLQECLE